MTLSRQNEARSRDQALLLSNYFEGSLYSAKYTDTNVHSKTAWSTTTLTHIGPGFDSSPVPLQFRAKTTPSKPSEPAAIGLCVIHNN